MATGRADGEGIGRRLRRLNAEIADGCALELACSAGDPRREDGLVLLGVLSCGTVAIVPVMPGRTARQRLLSLSDSIAECAMLLGVGTSLYGMSVRTGN